MAGCAIHLRPPGENLIAGRTMVFLDTDPPHNGGTPGIRRSTAPALGAVLDGLHRAIRRGRRG